MAFLRRLLGRPSASADAPAGEGTDVAPPSEDLEAAERARERELLRGESARLDELQQQQLRYADYAWRPPAQGGDRRADDAEGTDED